jgi:predicted restriction endonuclease
MRRRIKRNVVRNFLDPQYIKWRKAVYKRDNYQCQWPGCKIKKRLNAHHIRRWSKYPGLRFSINNGITLCCKHHKFIHGKEDYYVIVFSQILQMKAKNV